MEKVLVSLLIAFVFLESFSNKGVAANLDNGASCSSNANCKSGCCLRPFGKTDSNCAKKSSASEECGTKVVGGRYYRCPCESGLTCDVKQNNAISMIADELGICTS